MADLHTRHCDTNYTNGARCTCGGDVTTLSVDQLRDEVRRLRAIIIDVNAALRKVRTNG